jgi:hypothetical protein
MGSRLDRTERRFGRSVGSRDDVRVFAGQARVRVEGQACTSTRDRFLCAGELVDDLVCSFSLSWRGNGSSDRPQRLWIGDETDVAHARQDRDLKVGLHGLEQRRILVGDIDLILAAYK